MWCNMRAVALNDMLQLLVIYRFVTSSIFQDGLYFLSSIDNSINCVENDPVCYLLKEKEMLILPICGT